MQNKAKILCSNSLLSGFYCLLDDVKKYADTDMFKDNIIVVPDKFTLNAERLVFEYLNMESAFNIQVMSLTRLVNKVLSQKIKNYEVISQNVGQMRVAKIMLDNKDKFALYKQITPSVCAEFYNTIIQLKSSGILPSELKSKNQDFLFSMKLEDIKFVYEEYLKQNGEAKLDSADLLELFAKEITNSTFIQNSNVFVAMFDSFSYRQLECVVSLCKVSPNFEISLSASTLQKNKKIYVNETLQQVLQAFRKNKIEFEIENKLHKITEQVDFFAQNLFSKRTKKLVSNNVLLAEAQDEVEEVDFVARQIKFLVAENGYKFSDINVACANLQDYKLSLEKIFNQYHLPVYFDYSKSLDSHFFVKFIYNLFDLVRSRFEVDSVREFLKSPFLKVSNDEFDAFDNYITKYGIDHEVFFKTFFDADMETIRAKYLSVAIDFFNKSKKCKTASDFSNLIICVAEQLKCQQALEEICTSSEFDIGFLRATSQVYEKFTNVLSVINQTLGDIECDIEYYYSLLQNAVSQVTLSTVPLGVNKIFVGDANASSFYPSKCLFVVGAVVGSLPQYKNDCGMITDREIGNLSSNNLLSPSIQFVNKCAKYACFELLLKANERLCVSYPSLLFGVESRPSEIFDAIEQCVMTRTNTPLSLYKISSELDYLTLNSNINLAKSVFGNTLHTKKLLSVGDDSRFEHVKQLVCEETPLSAPTKSSFDYKTFYFPKNTVSVSQIERYFACPYLHFAQYGLRLKEREVFGLKSVDFGNFLHKVAEEFVNVLIDDKFEYSKEKTEKLINNLAKAQFMDNSYTVEKSKVNSLVKEALIMCERIQTQISLSEFKPQAVEEKFVSKTAFEGLKLIGKIDRVDAWQNFIVIYDYKTGKSDFSFKDVFYGNKIQSLIYLSMLENINKVSGVGAFYIPIKSKFIDEEFEDKFNGVFLEQNEIVSLLDKSIRQNSKSNIFKIKYKNDGSLHSTSSQYALSPLEFSSLKAYVLNVFDGAIKEICAGNITPSPTTEACNYCQFKTMCKFNQETGGSRKRELVVNKTTFMPSLMEETHDKRD